MATSYITEPDPEFEHQVRIIRVSGNPGLDGIIMGWATGVDAAEDAIDVAAILTETGYQPTAEGCARLHYTPKPGSR